MELLGYDFVQRGLLVGVLIAISSALTGVFLILRRLAFLGAGLSHFAFGGIALSILLGVEPFLFTTVLVLLLANGVEFLRRERKIGGDISLAVVFSGGVALAVVLLGISGGFRESLFSYLFGNILIVSSVELYMSIAVFLAVILFLTFYFKSFVLLSFNEDIAKVKGAPVRFLNYLLVSVASLVVMVSIKAVGVLLASSFVVIPSMVGIMLSKSLKGSMLISSLVAVLSTLSGILISLNFDLAPGGSIVMVMILTFLIALVVKKR